MSTHKCDEPITCFPSDSFSPKEKKKQTLCKSTSCVCQTALVFEVVVAYSHADFSEAEKEPENQKELVIIRMF